ncbi:CocE/NonD family hydrolase [Streptomyces phytophilus]|uniref:CocE/NonD family hydrolase n=1 Tax=Streptomyces phytophilus TaxID=722715 RepID=UPI0015F1136F|nr:CocE/NonD family hydrolase [Streptomyces phytophilus]
MKETMLRNIGLVTRDGTVLAADACCPSGEGPWPALIVYVPYNKDMWIGPRWANRLGYFASRGYVSVLVDFRGTGASGGSKGDAFEAVESADVYDIVEAVADKPWCDGRVGMWGVSYGGITSLRAAAVAPPHLKAVVAIEGSTDPYEYEVMRNGAPGLAMIEAEWASIMLAVGAVPPVAGVPGGDVEAVARGHYDGLCPWVFPWMDHIARDDYWAGREVDAGLIEVPTMIVTSWRDTNPTGAWRDFNAVTGPRRIIAGPWQHGLPDCDATDPIDTLHEMCRWFETWIRGEESGLAAEPVVSAYVLGAGEWEGYDSWPPVTKAVELFLTASGGLVPVAPLDRSDVPVLFDASVGLQGGLGMAHPPGEQTEDDVRSTLFESAPLEETLDIVDRVRVELAVTVQSLETDIAVRLVDVDPTGRGVLVARGFLSLSNLPPYVGDGIEVPETRAHVDLHPVRYRVRRCHRLRLAVAAADFPEIWPGVTGSDYLVVAGGPDPSRILVPCLTAPALSTPTFGKPDMESAAEVVQTNDSTLDVFRGGPDEEAGVVGHTTTRLLATDGSPVEFEHEYRITTVPRRPERTQLATSTRIVVTHPDRRLEIEARTDRDQEVAEATVEVVVDGEVFFSKSFQHHRGMMIVPATGSAIDAASSGTGEPV